MLTVTTAGNKPPRRRLASPRVLHLLGLAAAIAITLVILLFRDDLQQLYQYGYAGIFLVTMIGNASLVLPAPSFLAALAGGGVFNPLVVGLVAASGGAIGEMTGYLAGASGRGLVGNPLESERIQRLIQRYGLLTIFVLAVLPNPFFDLAGMTAGALRVPVWRFLLVTWSGQTIKFLLIALIGAGAVDFLLT
jgi:membrane protein YqaA with SNARE-associated domain